MKKKVLIPTKLERECRDVLERHGGYEVIQDDKTPILELARQHPDAHALVVRSERVTKEVLDALPALKVVVRAGSGYDTIDAKYARKRGVDVMNTPGANANAVAEEVIAMMLADARHIVKADPSCRAGRWEKKAFMGREITGKTVGIVGLGAIGKLVAKRLSGFECRILGCDPAISEAHARELGIEMVDLKTLFEQSDYVTLHVPENDETRGMVNAELLSRMKPGATLINCARAGIVVEEDLRRIKKEKNLRFLNDVYPKDEEGPKSVADIADLMLPHLGASTYEANANAARRAAEQLIEYDEKGIATYVVNRGVPAGLDERYGELAFMLARLCRGVVGRDTQLRLIETSFYGELKPYAAWLLVPIVAALSDEFDRSSDPAAARAWLRERGIEYDDRETDERKGYKSSITVDLTGSLGAETLRHASVRGTVAEGTVMVSRINDFDKLYFEPKGPTVVFSYKDRPGVLGQIGQALAAAGINIDDVRNPHDSRGEESIAILKVNQPVPDAVVRKIADTIQARMAFYMEF